MADTSKLRMNLAAIKRVDPYAKDIVDSTAHVAFYTFNSCENEWEKTDVEGAFFIYSRNAEPFHSIFINNRLNTNSFVEPITGQLELQSQPPFLLYRNERSRIRGFWFYSSLECDRIGQIVTILVQRCDTGKLSEPDKQNNINIFNMLTKAQQDFSNSQNILSSVQDVASHNVLKFFASAKPASVSENQFFQRVFPNTLSVQQLEKQQRVRSPSVDTTLTHALHKFNSKIDHKNRALTNSPNLTINATPDLEMSPFSKFFIPCTAAKQINLSNLEDAPAKEKCYLRKLLNDIPIYESDSIKPALMPPTMFEKSENFSKTNGQTYMDSNEGKEPLNQTQFIQAFSYLITNDSDFKRKLHEAYLKSIA